MQRILQGIANKAQREKSYRFRNLYTMLNVQYLLESWRYLNKNAASGIDKISAKDYEKNLESNVNDLVERLKKKTYRAKLVRRKEIPKGNGKTRLLGIPAVEDKLLQVAVARILSSIFEEDFIIHSYGYRSGIGVKEAVKHLTDELQFTYYGYVVEADIQGFFDNIDHTWLLAMLNQRISDKALLNLIAKWLKAGILLENSKVIHPASGTPQGGVISPVLANIYLHYVLDIWTERKFSKDCIGKVTFIRYADDFICLFQRQEEAERFYNILAERLGKFNLELAIDKTQILLFDRNKMSKSKRFSFLGFEFYWGFSQNAKPIVKRRTCPKKLKSSRKTVKEWIKRSRSMKLKFLLKKLNSKLRGYYNYYGLIGNYKSLSLFSYFVECTLFKWLNRRSQKRSMNWKEFVKMLRKYGFQKPFISEKRNYQLSFCFN
ncbi:MAG: group II intron reverse transcriptase/maturase [Candidatus Cloacimonadota bacterium]|nr:MAG: group II intron reverse transcriptase/maturase [Candidatus Cloacimonadota bacterium]